MMNDAVRQKLTAFVDGELSPGERAAVERLLAEHPGARELVSALKRDAEEIRSLPQPKLPEDFADRVVRALNQRRPLPVRPIANGTNHRPGPKRWTRQPVVRWVGAIAASILLVGLGFGSIYLIRAVSGWHAESGPEFVSQPGEKPPAPQPVPDQKATGPNQLAGALKRPIDGEPDSASDTPGGRVSEGVAKADSAVLVEGWRQLLQPLHAGSQRIAQLIPQVASAFDQKETAPTDLPFAGPPILTGRLNLPTQPFKTMDVDFPFIQDMTEIDRSAVERELQPDQLYHVDLSCRVSWESWKRFVTACQKAGVPLLTDKEVSQRVSKKIPAVYMVYWENTTPERVADVLLALSQQEEAAEKSKKPRQYLSVLIQQLDERGRKQFAESLGIPFPLLRRRSQPKGAAPTDRDPRRPLTDDTLKSLEQVAAGKGGRAAKKDRASSPPSKAVAMVYYPKRVFVTLAPEVRQYLASETGWQPGKVHVVFILRPGRG